MTTTPLLTIGAFARAVGLTPSALRHYDECGLLPPAAVDESTGYRYYTPELAGRARLIVAMREADVPIEVMRRVVDGPPAEARAVLTDLVRARAADTARVEALLRDVCLDVDGAPTAQARARVDGRALAAALRQVRPAADADPTSPLSGVLVDVDAAGVDVVATNRYWMAVRTLERADVTGEGRVVLGLAEAARLAARLDGLGDVVVRVGHAELAIETADETADETAGEATASGRPEPYPAHRLVLDGLEPVTTTVLVRAAELSEAVVGTGRAEVRLCIARSGLTVEADDAPSYAVGGVARGPALGLQMGSALLLRALGSCLGAEVLIEAAASERPVRLRSPYQSGFVALVMPVRPA